jgi:hypothetical protein
MSHHDIISSYNKFFKHRGIHLINKVHAADGTICYVFDAAENPGDQGPSGKVGSVVFVRGSDVSMAFTTGSPLFEDNFDRDGYYQEVPIENCIFAALKLLIEMRAVARLENTDDNRALLLSKMYVIHEDVIKKANEKKYGESDPVVIQCIRDYPLLMSEDREAGMHELATLPFWKLKMKYLGLRQKILEKIPRTIPKIAKMSIGRNTIFPLIKQSFEGEELRLWGVYFARLFFLHKAANIENGVYPLLYTMMHKFGNQQEWSKDDDAWAMKNAEMRPTEESGPLCYFKEEYNGDSKAAEARAMIMANTVRPPKKKMLGRVNDWVTTKLQIEAGVPISMEERGEMDFEQREARAKYMLYECGWTHWFNKHFKTDFDLNVTDDFQFHGHLQTMIQNIKLSHVLNLLENVDHSMILGKW